MSYWLSPHGYRVGRALSALLSIIFVLIFLGYSEYNIAKEAKINKSIFLEDSSKLCCVNNKITLDKLDLEDKEKKKCIDFNKEKWVVNEDKLYSKKYNWNIFLADCIESN